MSLFSRLRAVWSSCFDKPALERSVEQAIKRQHPRRILEIGLGDGRRARGVLALAQRYHARHEVHFIGIDLFEDRHAGEAPFPLKEAYRNLRSTGARVRLVPGDAHGACGGGAAAADGKAARGIVAARSELGPSSLPSSPPMPLWAMDCRVG